MYTLEEIRLFAENVLKTNRLNITPVVEYIKHDAGGIRIIDMKQNNSMIFVKDCVIYQDGEDMGESIVIFSKIEQGGNYQVFYSATTASDKVSNFQNHFIDLIYLDNTSRLVINGYRITLY